MTRLQSTLWVVLTLTLAALGLRLAAVDTVLPHANEPDAALVAQSVILRGERGARYDEEQNYHAWAKYPHAVSLIMAGVPRPSAASEIDAGSSLERELRFAGRHFRAARIAVALLSVLVVPLTWLFARRFLGRGHALLAASFAATSLMLTNYGQQARPHAPLAVFALLAIYAACLLAEHGSILRYSFAGVCAALSVGTLHSGAFVLPALLAAHVLAVHGRSLMIARWSAHARGLIPLALLALSLPLFYPFLFDGVTEWEGSLSDHADFPHRVLSGWFNGRGFPKLWSFLWDEDPVMFALALIGIVLGGARLASRRGKNTRNSLVVTLAALLPCVLLLGVYENIFNRFLAPLAPFAAVLAAYAVAEVSDWLARLLPGPRSVKVLHGVLALSALALPTFLSVKLTVIRSRADTSTLAARWVEENVKRDSERVLITPTLPIPLFRKLPSGEDSPISQVKLPWYYAQWVLADAQRTPSWDIRLLTRDGRLPVGFEDYPRTRDDVRAILDEVRGQYCLATGGAPLLDNMRSEVAQRGDLVTQITPWKSVDGPPGGMGYQGHRFYRDVLAAERMGPMIWVYELR